MRERTRYRPDNLRNHLSLKGSKGLNTTRFRRARSVSYRREALRRVICRSAKGLPVAITARVYSRLPQPSERLSRFFPGPLPRPLRSETLRLPATVFNVPSLCANGHDIVYLQDVLRTTHVHTHTPYTTTVFKPHCVFFDRNAAVSPRQTNGYNNHVLDRLHHAYIMCTQAILLLLFTEIAKELRVTFPRYKT